LLFLEHPNQHTVIFSRSNSNGRIRQFQYLTVISTYYLSILSLLYILKCHEVIIATNVHSMQRHSSERITEGGLQRLKAEQWKGRKTIILNEEKGILRLTNFKLMTCIERNSTKIVILLSVKRGHCDCSSSARQKTTYAIDTMNLRASERKKCCNLYIETARKWEAWMLRY
jgi:hypothetical protein